MPDPHDPVVVGAYTTEQVRESTGRSGLSYALEALRGALDDAGLEKQDVQGLYAMLDAWPNAPGNQSFYGPANWPFQLGVPVNWFTGAVNSAGTGAAAMLDAAAAIKTRNIDTAALVVGRARAPNVDGKTAPWTRNQHEFTEWTGSLTAAQFALTASRHMHQYGTTREQLSRIAAIIRNNGSVNPSAVMFGRGPYTTKEVMESRMIADPLTVLMCALVNDGGGALVMTSWERARTLRRPPVLVRGGADQLSYPAYQEAPILERHVGGPFSRDWVKRGFGLAGVTHEDVDFIQLYDGFSVWAITQLEMFGFCGEGEGGPLAESGALDMDGRHPVCTDGGCMSFSHNGTPSLYRSIEAVRQLRGETHDLCPGWETGLHSYDRTRCRAVRDPKIGFAAGMGPPTGGGNFVIMARA